MVSLTILGLYYATTSSVFTSTSSSFSLFFASSSSSAPPPSSSHLDRQSIYSPPPALPPLSQNSLQMDFSILARFSSSARRSLRTLETQLRCFRETLTRGARARVRKTPLTFSFTLINRIYNILFFFVFNDRPKKFSLSSFFPPFPILQPFLLLPLLFISLLE